MPHVFGSFDWHLSCSVLSDSVQKSLEMKFARHGGSIPVTPSESFEKRISVCQLVHVCFYSFIAWNGLRGWDVLNYWLTRDANRCKICVKGVTCRCQIPTCALSMLSDISKMRTLWSWSLVQIYFAQKRYSIHPIWPWFDDDGSLAYITHQSGTWFGVLDDTRILA